MSRVCSAVRCGMAAARLTAPAGPTELALRKRSRRRRGGEVQGRWAWPNMRMG